LEPYVFLDELQLDPDALARPEGVLGPFFDLAFASWKRHRLPTLPGLGFSLVRIHPHPGMPVPRATRGIRLHGQSFLAEPGFFSFAGKDAYPLAMAAEAHGIRLTGSFPHDPQVSRMMAIIPTLPGQQRPSEAQREQLGSWPLVTLPLPKDGRDAALQVEVCLRAQEAHMRICLSSGRLAARARADMCYFRQRGPSESGSST
jgi:hypothetical protein